jgi:hypothetical protein
MERASTRSLRSTLSATVLIADALEAAPPLRDDAPPPAEPNATLDLVFGLEDLEDLPLEVEEAPLEVEEKAVSGGRIAMSKLDGVFLGPLGPPVLVLVIGFLPLDPTTPDSAPAEVLKPGLPLDGLLVLPPPVVVPKFDPLPLTASGTSRVGVTPTLGFPLPI